MKNFTLSRFFLPLLHYLYGFFSYLCPLIIERAGYALNDK